MSYGILIVLLLITYLFLSVRNLELALQLLLFALPAYLIRFNIGPLPSTALEVMIWVVFLVWFAKSYKQVILNLKLRYKNNWKLETGNWKLINYPFGSEIILLLLVSFVAVGVSGFSNAAFGIWKAYFFEPLLLYIVVINIFGENFKPSKLLWPLAASALAVSLVAIYQKLTGDLIDNPFWAAEATRRAVSVFGYPNAVGLYLGPLVLLFIGWLAYAKFICKAPKKLQLVIALSITFSFIAIIFAKSKGALFGITAGLAVFGMLASRRSRIATIGIIVFAATACATVPLARHAVWERMSLQDFSGTVRRIGWRDSYKMLSDGHLLLGAGLANFQKAVAPYHQEGFFISDGTPDFYERLKTDAALRARTWQPLEIYLYPHNIFLNFWSELGLAGLLLFVWIIGKYFVTGFRLQSTSSAGRVSGYRFLTIGLICAMVVIVVHGLVDVPYFKNDLAVMFWLFIAMLGLIRMSGICSAGRDSENIEISANSAKIKQSNS